MENSGRYRENLKQAINLATQLRSNTNWPSSLLVAFITVRLASLQRYLQEQAYHSLGEDTADSKGGREKKGKKKRGGDKKGMLTMS